MTEQSTAPTTDTQQREGLLAPVPAGQQAVVTRSGNVGLIDEKDVEQAKLEGAHIASDQELRHQQAKEVFGGTAGELATGAVNFADMLSFGAGKGALVKGAELLGGEQAARELALGLQAGDEVNPSAATAGQIAGLAGGLFLGSGELGLGRIAESGAAKAFGGKIIPSIAKLAVEGGEIGAMQGAGTAFSDAELGNEDDVAEKMLAGAAKGGLLGIGIGAGLGLAGGAISKAGSAIAERASGAVEGTSVGELVRGAGESAAFSAAGPKLSDVRKLAKYGVDEKVIGRFMLDELPKVADKPFARMSREEIATASKKVAESYGERISTAVDSIDVVAMESGKAANASTIVERMQKEVLDPLRSLPGYEGVVKKVANYIDSFGEKTGVFVRDSEGGLVHSGTEGTASFKQLHKFRQGLDDLIFRGNKALSDEPIVQELRSVRSILEEEIGSQGSKITPQAGEEYAAAKAGYRKAKTVADIAEDRVLREEANRSISMTDYLTGIAGAASLGPGGALLALGNKVLRERGNQIVAGLFDRMSRVSSLQAMKVETGVMNARIANAGRAIVRTGAKGASTVALSRAQQTEQILNHVQELAMNPERVRQEVKDHIDSQVAPNVSAKYVERTAAAINYLAQTAPKGTPVVPVLADLVKSKPSPLEMAAWQRRVDVFKDPIGTTLSAVKTGRLTSEHVDALDAMYPRIAGELRTAILTELAWQARFGKAPKFTKLLQLGTILKAPTDSLLEPQSIASMQEIVSGDVDASAGDEMSGGVAPRTKSTRESMQTEGDRLEAGNDDQ